MHGWALTALGRAALASPGRSQGRPRRLLATIQDISELKAYQQRLHSLAFYDTLTGLPNFPSFTSGHSTFSGAAATFLSYLFPEKANHYEAMAQEASNSRMYGAIHYRSDCEVGLQMGKAIGNNTIARSKTDGAGL